MRERNREPLTIIALLMVVAGLVLLGACSAETRYRVLSVFFEGVPEPGQKAERKPVIRHARRLLPSPVATPQVMAWELGAPQEERKGWLDKLLAKLPKDSSGNFDMARALNEKLIEPKASIDPGAKEQPVLNLDVVLEPKGQPKMKVVFSHKAHTQWLACANCHPEIFKMKKGADPITMAAIFGGKYCGRCHGKVAFAVPTGCARCHESLKGGQ